MSFTSEQPGPSTPIDLSRQRLLHQSALAAVALRGVATRVDARLAVYLPNCLEVRA